MTRPIAASPKCYELAQYFYPDAAQDFLSSLAEEIQQIVEDKAFPIDTGIEDEDDRTMRETGYC